MAISRYSQPVQAQYIPMDNNAYRQMGLAAIQAQQKPWQLIAGIEDSKQRNYGAAIGAQSQLEEGLAGHRAINAQDQKELEAIKTSYMNAINDAIDKTHGDPGAMLPALTQINRSYRMDTIGGKLAQIDTHYKMGMEDLKQAKKDVSTGKLSQEGYNVQVQLLGTGLMVPRTGDIDSSAKSMLSGNKGFGTGNIHAAYMQNMRNKYAGIYGRLNVNGRKDMDKQFETAWQLYGAPVYGNKVAREGNSAFFTPTVDTEEGRKQVNSGIRDDLFTWGEDGNSVKFNKKSEQKLIADQQYELQHDPFAFEHGIQPGDKNYVDYNNLKNYEKETQKKIETFVDKYHIPDNKDVNGKSVPRTLKEKYELAKTAAEEMANKNYTGQKMKKIKGYHPISLTTPDGKLKSFIGQTVEVDGSKVLGKDFTKTIADKLKIKDATPAKVAAELKSMDVTGEIFTGGKNAMKIKYKITNAKKEGFTVIAPITDPETVNALQPLSLINTAIGNSQLDKIIPMQGEVTLPIKLDNGKVEEKPVTDFMIRYDGANMKPVVFAYTRSADGKPVPIMVGVGGMKHKAVINKDVLLDKTLGKIMEQNRSYEK